MTSSKVSIIKRLVGLGFSAEEALAMAGADDTIMGMAIDSPAIPAPTSAPVPAAQETKDDWSVGNYKFGAVSVTLLERKDDTHFRALIFPVGMRQDHSIQPSKLSVQLLDAMKRSFSGIVVDDSPTDTKQTTPKQDRATMAEKTIAAYIADNPDIVPVHTGFRTKGIKNAFIWTSHEDGLMLHRLGIVKDGYTFKGMQPVKLDHPGKWASREDGRYSIK